MKKHFLILLLLFAPIILMAQQPNLQYSKRYSKAETDSKFKFGISKDTVDWIINRPMDNWFLTANIGIQSYIGSEIVPSYRWNGLTPFLDFEIYKTVIPDLAVGLSFSGFNSVSRTRSGGNPYVDFTGVAPLEDGTMPYKSFNFNYFALNGEVMLNWTNFIHGYTVGGFQKKFHFLSIIGLGFARETGTPVNPSTDYTPINYELTALIGFRNAYIISEKWSLNVTAKCMIARRSFDYSNEVGCPRFDMIPSLSAGLTYSLNKQARHVFVPVELNLEMMTQLAADYVSREDSLVQRYEAILADTIKDQQNEIDSLRGMIGVAQTLPAKVVNAINQNALQSAYVFFELDKFEITDRGMLNLKTMAAFIKDYYPDRTFLIIGSADAKTGSVEHNRWLSQKRCQAVYDALVKKFGVNQEQLEMRPVGGIADYEPYELNRLSIVVIDDPEVLKIIEGVKKHKSR